MKIILCVLVSASLVASVPQTLGNTPAAHANPKLQAIPSARSNVAAANPINPYGVGFFGPGINNPFAIRPDPGLINVARQIIQSNPNLRVRVLTNGEAEITDEFGVQRNVVDAFGNNPLEAFDPEERLELEQERRELQLEQQLHQERLRLRQQLLKMQLRQTNLRGNAVNSAGPSGSHRFFVAN